MSLRTNDTLRRRLLAVALIAAVWALALWLTGGIHVEPFGLRISSSDPKRPLIAAILLFAVYAAAWPAAFRSHFADLGARLLRQPAAIAAGLSVAVLAAGLTDGATVAGAADPYGYVSQAALWRHRELAISIPLVARVPWPDPQWTFAPLGYRPSTLRADAIVPTYAPGLPLLMALFQLAGGFGGAFVVVPLSGALLVWLAFVLGRRVFGSDGIALWAAALVAASPAFLFQLMWPMSDVPVAAAWTAALVLAVSGWPLASGLTMSAAIAIRPNLVLLPVSLVLWQSVALLNGTWRARLSGAPVRTIAGLIPGVAFIAWLNRHLYGSPLASGYGDAAGIFAAGRAGTNAAHYGAWLVTTQTPLVLFAIAYFAAARWCAAPRIRHPRLLLGGTIAATIASYLFYEVFADWWYLRFLLPMWPALMLCVAAGIDGLLRRWAARVRPIALAAAVAFLAIVPVRIAADRNAFGVGRGERRYVDVARYVAAHTPPDAVVFSMQHSGSIREYGRRLTIRYDMIPEGGLDAAAAWLASNGRHPYIVVEKWEVEPFRARHGASGRLGRLDWPPIAKLAGWNDVAVYDAAAPGGAVTTATIAPVFLDRRSGWPPPPADPLVPLR